MFINFDSHRSGWIPNKSEVPLQLAQEYGWIFGTSITEMEIIHGAFRKANPNGLLLLIFFIIITDLKNIVDSIYYKSRKKYFSPL